MSKKKSDHTDNKLHRKTKLAIVFLFIGLILLSSFISFFIYWQEDFSLKNHLSERNIPVENFIGAFGFYTGNLFIYEGFGLSTFILVGILLFLAYCIFFQKEKYDKRKIVEICFFWLIIMIFISFILGFFTQDASILAGRIGFELNSIFQNFFGKLGTAMITILVILLAVVQKFNIAPHQIIEKFESAGDFIRNNFKLKNQHSEESISGENNQKQNKEKEEEEIEDFEEEIKENYREKSQKDKKVEEFIINNDFIDVQFERKEEKSNVYTHKKDIPSLEMEIFLPEMEKKEEEISDFEVNYNEEKKLSADELSRKLVEDFGEYDPTLELSSFEFPPINLLKDYKESVVRNDEELNENKNKIIEVLKSFDISITQIKATIGPTVTLYEIVPAAGIRISKIKNLEDDIALSLAALGIRIIAPIPGKGTIGIEVPNQTPSIVSMRSVISSQKFEESQMELPIAFGKTITNETFLVDLAKMPHLLMAGATGQGKSVGLNAVLTSLLYKKHPAEVKFVLVDPKKVELSIYNKIERHYLAKLPDTEKAIITDNDKVINTLNSLCIEMDSRLLLLENASARNIKEYNTKFKERRLNPEEGHRFLPYIILVVDEFADLIMTAGKEVELPIARLAQLARATGIHLIIATQRPSVNVITGMIKANFPARVAFKVTAAVDSKTILDTTGANQLIGKGDMLFTQGNDLTRIQCAFIDTPEVEKIVDFISEQTSYPEAYALPEFVGSEIDSSQTTDVSKRDALFKEAAEIVVARGEAAASNLQSVLSIGFPRAAKIINQLADAGIIGKPKGSKPREVLMDMTALQYFFEREKEK